MNAKRIREIQIEGKKLETKMLLIGCGIGCLWGLFTLACYLGSI